MKEIIYYELLETGQPVEATRYSQQSNCINEEINKRDWTRAWESKSNFVT